MHQTEFIEIPQQITKKQEKNRNDRLRNEKIMSCQDGFIEPLIAPGLFDRPGLHSPGRNLLGLLPPCGL